MGLSDSSATMRRRHSVPSLFLLAVVVHSCHGYRPYPDPGPDIPPWQRFCATRWPRDQQCCPDRRDNCTVPILDTICYCDEFCDRTISDCCPDFWSVCRGARPPPTRPPRQRTTTPRYVRPPTPRPPPEHCSLPVVPAPQPDVPASAGVRFGVSTESRYEYSRMPRSISAGSEFSVDFKTTVANGTIFYVADNNNVDFVGLYMKNGQVGFAFNCGSGTARAVTSRTYNDGRWHTVTFSRTRNSGFLNVDGGFDISLQALGSTTTVDVTSPYYLGGLPQNAAADAANNLDGIDTRFVGCLRNFKQGFETIAAPDYDVGTEPCSPNTEYGTFFYREGGHLILDERYSVPLDLEIRLEVKPRTLSGVLLSVYSHGSGPPGGDYLVLQLVNGEVIFSMDNGQGEVKAVFSPPAKNELCDGEWHRIKAVKAKNVVTLEVDGIITNPGLGQAGVAHTNTLDPLYVGGVPEFHRGIKTRDQYVGCMRNLQLGTEMMSLSEARLVGRVNLAGCPTN